jgi:TolB-like protein
MKTIIAVLILIISSGIANSQQSKTVNDSTITPKLFFLAKTEFGQYAKDIKQLKIDAALNFSARASNGQYQYAPLAVIDSLVAKGKNNGDTLTSLKIASMLNADYFIFLRVNRIENMIRIDIRLVNARDTSIKSFGTGYASIRYRRLTNEKPLYDPAILSATMRAFAVASKDSNLFVKGDTIIEKPVPTLVIGGIAYKDDEKLKTWEVFTHKEISSYDAVENLFDEIKNNPDFATYDIQTRDSLFAIYNLMMIENYKGPTADEIKILFNMDVNYYITGTLSRIESGGILDLYFCRINDKANLEILGKESGLLGEDNIEQFKKVLRKTVSNLMSRKFWVGK